MYTALDTGGGPRYEGERPWWCRQADAFIVCFSTTSREISDSIRQFSKEIGQNRPQGRHLALVGTETDIRPSMVSCEEGLRRAERLGAQYFPVSVKKLTEAMLPFDYLVQRHLSREDMGTNFAESEHLMHGKARSQHSSSTVASGLGEP